MLSLSYLKMKANPLEKLTLPHRETKIAYLFLQRAFFVGAELEQRVAAIMMEEILVTDRLGISVAYTKATLRL